MSYHEHEMDEADTHIDINQENLDLVSLLDDQENNNNDTVNNDNNNNNIDNPHQNVIFRFNLGKYLHIS